MRIKSLFRNERSANCKCLENTCHRGSFPGRFRYWKAEYATKNKTTPVSGLVRALSLKLAFVTFVTSAVRLVAASGTNHPPVIITMPIAPVVPPGFRNRPPGPDPYLSIPPTTNTARLQIESTLPRSFWGRYSFPEWPGSNFVRFDYKHTQIPADRTHYWITFDSMVEIRCTLTNDCEAHIEACTAPYGVWYFVHPIKGPVTNFTMRFPVADDSTPYFYRIRR